MQVVAYGAKSCFLQFEYRSLSLNVPVTLINIFFNF
jgi:hypothetical protein